MEHVHVDIGSQLQHVLQPPGHSHRAGAGMCLPPVVQPACVVLGVHQRPLWLDLALGTKRLCHIEAWPEVDSGVEPRQRAAAQLLHP